MWWGFVFLVGGGFFVVLSVNGFMGFMCVESGMERYGCSDSEREVYLQLVWV
jgi:hypothetical protein